jgi:hypothetical protein
MKMARLLFQVPAFLAVFAQGVASGAPAAGRIAAGQVPSAKEMEEIRQEVEMLRGKKFQRDVPARTISEKDLRAMVECEIAKAYPGRKLADVQELMAWLDMVPPNTDLARVCADFVVGQVAGLYDSDTRTMCIPSFPGTNRPAVKDRKNPSQKKLEEIQGPETGLVFSHEFTHALEDEYWPMDALEDENSAVSNDRKNAQSFLYEGSATRLMVEAMPAELERQQPGSYLVLWNLLHSGAGEEVLEVLLSHVWKGPEVKVPGVPETLARSEAMPYSFGYVFCTGILRDWGLDGLDYIYDHPPVTTEQVMHPGKCWEWRDFPVQITLPETLSGGWKQVIDDTIGEADTAVLLGCALKNLNRGQRVACGWDGDHVALYEAAGGRRLLVWASAWDSKSAAERFARAWVEERRVAHHAARAKKRGPSFAWTLPDGRAGMLRCDGKRVLLFETDQAAALDHCAAWTQSVTFTEPPEDAARAAENRAWLRFDPMLSWRKDGDYEVTKSLGGLLWRHDRNSVGVADRALLGIAGEWRRTTSFDKWRLGWGLVAKHESEARRGVTKTTLLPWGVLCSHFSTVVPQSPANTLSRNALLWGLAASQGTDASGRHVLTLLPAGLLFRSTTGSNETCRHFLGTGLSRRQMPADAGATTRFRVFGIPVWTRHTTQRDASA